MNPFSRNPSAGGSTSARPHTSTSKAHSPTKPGTHPKSAKQPRSNSASFSSKPKPKPKLPLNKMKHQTISASDLFGHNFKRSSASPRPSVITTTKPSGTSTSTYAASNFSSAHSNASSTSSHAPVQPKPTPTTFDRDFSLSPPPPLSPPPIEAPELPPAPPAPIAIPAAVPSTIISIPKIKLRLGGMLSANSTPRPSPPLPLPATEHPSDYPVASTSTLPKSAYAPTTSTTHKKRKVSGQKEEIPVFVSAADTLLTAGTSSRPNVHRVFSPSVPPSPTASHPPPSAIHKAKAAMKGKGKAQSNPAPLVGPIASMAKGKGKGKGKGRARDESVDLLSPTKPFASLPYPSNEASTSTLPPAPPPPKAASPRPTTSSKKIRALFEDSDDSLTSLPSEFQSSDSSSSDDGLDSDGKPDILFISSSKRHLSQTLSSSEDNSELDSDSSSGTFSSTTNGAEDDMESDEDEMMREEEDLFRREGRRRHGGGKRKGGWENVRDRGDGLDVSSGGSDGYSHHDPDELDDDDDDEDEDETDAYGLGGRSAGASSGGGGGGIKVLTFDAAGDRVGSWSEDSSDEDEEEDLWFDNMSDFDLEEDVLVGADGIGGMIPVDGEEMYETFDDDGNALAASAAVSRPFDLPRNHSASSSRRTSAERRASAALDMDYDMDEDDEEGEDAMAEMLSRGVGDGEPGSMLIMEDWDGQLVFGAGSLDGSGGAFEFATESEGDSDGQKDADRMEDLWDDEDGLADENYEGDYEGDTTDSLPDDEDDDDLVLPPDLYAALTTSTASSSNAASTTGGVHADSPAAIFGLPSPVDGTTNFNIAPIPPTILVEPASPHPHPSSQGRSQSGKIGNSPLSHPILPIGRLAAKSQGPVMGSFLPAAAANPVRSVIIDGRAKDTETPSPFARKSSRGRGKARGSKSGGVSSRKQKGDGKDGNPFSPTPTKRARYGAPIPGPTQFSFPRHNPRADSPVSSPDLLPAPEPVSLEDVLDSSLLYHGNSDGSNSASNSHAQANPALSRWDRIPIGTFRGRARGQAATHLVGSRAATARPLERFNPSPEKETSIFRDGSGGNGHFATMGLGGGGGMALSPVMGPQTGMGDGGELTAGGRKKRKRGRRESSIGGASLRVPDGFRLDG